MARKPSAKTIADVTALVVEHVSASHNPLQLLAFAGSHECMSDSTIVLFREGGDYNTGHDYWVDAAADNEALRAALAEHGRFVEPVHCESIAICLI